MGENHTLWNNFVSLVNCLLKRGTRGTVGGVGPWPASSICPFCRIWWMIVSMNLLETNRVAGREAWVGVFGVQGWGCLDCKVDIMWEWFVEGAGSRGGWGWGSGWEWVCVCVCGGGGGGGGGSEAMGCDCDCSWCKVDEMRGVFGEGGMGSAGHVTGSLGYGVGGVARGVERGEPKPGTSGGGRGGQGWWGVEQSMVGGRGGAGQESGSGMSGISIGMRGEGTGVKEERAGEFGDGHQW